jgi:hypothetical protein
MPRGLPDKSKTLDELEGVQWWPPKYNSYLVTTCHGLRTKPLADFAVEDLRIMIGQGIGLAFLIPMALEVVEANAMAQGDYYPGDLLQSLLGVSRDVWAREWGMARPSTWRCGARYTGSRGACGCDIRVRRWANGWVGSRAVAS